MKKIALITATILFFPLICISQTEDTIKTTIVTPTKPKPKLKLSYRLALNGQYNSGNVNRTLIANRNTLNLQYGKLKTPVVYNFSFGKFKGKVNEREHFLQLNPTYELGKVKYYYSTEGEISNLRGIRNRIMVGAGVGYSIVEKKEIDVTVSNLIFNENTNYVNLLHKHTIRSSTRLRVKADIGNIRISSVGFYQPSLENFDNYRWTNNNSLEVKIFKPVSTTINYDQSYESFVVGNKVKYNNSLMIGFIYRFE
jgi:hypothetical protein